MKIAEEISMNQKVLTELRQDIHAHPETGFELSRTASIVAEYLDNAGIEVYRGIGETGVVGVLQVGSSDCAIGLRADMDALCIQEANTFEYRSKNDGKMHACGHDGHTVMLLGAAEYLAKTRKFNGTVVFIFQPAEELGKGAIKMIEDGLFDRFPMNAIYGLHNMPGIPAGQIRMRKGALFAGISEFTLKIMGIEAHPATQHLSPDTLLVANQIITAWQTIKARRVNPVVPMVLGVTQIQAGDPYNTPQAVHISPSEVYMRGDILCMDEVVHNAAEIEMERIADHICQAFGVKMEMTFVHLAPPMVNTDVETDLATSVATEVVGPDAVYNNCPVIVGAEDFSFMLNHRPGCYILLGNGKGEGQKGGCMIHNSKYDFNDDVIPTGVAYWSRLVETVLQV